MKKTTRRTLASAIAVALLASYSSISSSNPNNNTSQNVNKSKLNFVTIVIDDLGYSDIGVFGSEIDTPNLDKLAGKGVILSNFYAAATSSVSRSMLFSGKDNHKNGLGNMIETMTKTPRVEQLHQPGYEGVLSLDTLPFPEVLKDNDYNTLMTGKWHLGGSEEGEKAYAPINRGFSATKSVLLGGGDIDFMKNAKGMFLTEHDDTFGGRKSLYNDNGVESDFTDLPNLTHSTDNFTNSAIALLKGRDKNKPFYLDVSYLAPHSPFQAPKALIDKYVATYSVGWDQIRQERFAHLKQKGYVVPSATLSPRPGDVKAWNDLTEREKRFEAQRMAIYAAEVDLLDQNVGHLIQYLKDNGQYENTVFFVYSDNGAADTGFGHAPKGLIDHNKVKINDISDAKFTQLLDDLGGSTSFISANTGWGHVQGTPFRDYKGATTDGGIRDPAFVSYAGAKTKGVTSGCLYSVMDIAPTILEMSGTSYPTKYHGKPNEPMNGESMASIFKGDLSCNTDRSLGFEIDGLIGLRKGDYKLAQGYAQGTHVGLYNVVNDPSEINDLSEDLPDLYSTMKTAYRQYASEHGVIEVNPLYLPDLSDSATTTAKIRGGSSFINKDNKTFSFKAKRSISTDKPISIDGEIRAESSHVGKPAEVFVNIKDADTGKTFYLTESGLTESTSPIAYKKMDMPKLLTLSIVHGVLSNTVLNGLKNLEVRIGYTPTGGVLIENTNKPIKVTVTQ